jgi:ABC-type nickel/cobalt efflux system permease component RcnA
MTMRRGVSFSFWRSLRRIDRLKALRPPMGLRGRGRLASYQDPPPAPTPEGSEDEDEDEHEHEHEHEHEDEHEDEHEHEHGTRTRKALRAQSSLSPR